MTKKKVTDLKSEDNLLHRILDSIKDESRSIEKSDSTKKLAYLGFFITTFISVNAWMAANEAKSTAQTWQQLYKETDRECRLAQLEIDGFRIDLIEAGIKLDHGQKP